MRESSQTQLNQNKWRILKLDTKNYMFRPEVAIIRFTSKYLRVKLAAYISLTLKYFEENLTMATSGRNT
jgi:hypothetical protein